MLLCKKNMSRSKLDFILITLKGFTMGAANVIPGVSGGTIALITGIYEELINSLKSFDKKAIEFLLKREFLRLFYHINGKFLFFLLLGIVLSVFSIAKLFEYLLLQYPTQIWAFFFGLIFASVYYVGKTVKQWNTKNTIFFILGTFVALLISFTNPAPSSNESYMFVFFCGVIGISGMLLPGLSGSYILLLLGNYKLLMVDSINAISKSIKMLMIGDFTFLNNPDQKTGLIHFCLFLFGSIFGMISFSRLIAWIFKQYKNITIALLTGFIFGSLAIIWPWKNAILHPTILDRNSNPMIIKYERYFPKELDQANITSLLCIILGIICIWAVEKMAEKEI